MRTSIFIVLASLILAPFISQMQGESHLFFSHSDSTNTNTQLALTQTPKETERSQHRGSGRLQNIDVLTSQSWAS